MVNLHGGFQATLNGAYACSSGVSMKTGSIAFIGFGEAARAFLDGWRSRPGFDAPVAAYDIKTDSPDGGSAPPSAPTTSQRA